MGAWGHQFDENDDAADWLSTFSDDPSWAAVEEVLEAATGSEYLEAPEASMALAALEILAAANGKPSARLEQSLAVWASENAAGRATAAAKAEVVLANVRNESELAELWNDGEEGDLWRSTVDELTNRLNS